MAELLVLQLDRAIKAGDVANIAKALDEGASPDGDKNAGKKPIHLAVETGLVQITKLLLERGANLNVANPEDHGRRPLHMAVVRGFDKIVKCLLKRKRRPQFSRRCRGNATDHCSKKG
ncbi:cyclin-dependent kinase 4 inhibitor D-like [Penaeus indicus]|uniref:cyclin-dependent kinase 4 inhibitor D-like n=1 Tax=Penaeus indicus TaxID=29960 RepID=UPI00300D5CCF